MTERERIIKMVMDAPDEQIVRLFADMGITIDLTGDKPAMDIETRDSEEMMFTHFFGSANNE